MHLTTTRCCYVANLARLAFLTDIPDIRRTGPLLMKLRSIRGHNYRIAQVLASSISLNSIATLVSLLAYRLPGGSPEGKSATGALGNANSTSSKWSEFSIYFATSTSPEYRRPVRVPPRHQLPDDQIPEMQHCRYAVAAVNTYTLEAGI